MKILVVEDEPDIVYMLRYNLEKDGHSVIDADLGAAALQLAEDEAPDLILLDWGLDGDMDGTEVCRAIRRNPRLHRLPVIMLTARSQEADKVRGLSVGADDYLTKPFSLLELSARIKALMRRSAPSAERGRLAFADLSMEAESCRVARSEVPVHLGPTEFRLLQFLMENPRTVFSREDLLAQIWGDALHVEARTVDVHIRRLRTALGDPDLIRTVRGSGYSLDDS
ncbi:DNA-binding response regulator [Alphaproteobacteria bacterium]|nr:DNA-binding response regulator [Alphaproteobacteria bacterium]